MFGGEPKFSTVRIFLCGPSETFQIVERGVAGLSASPCTVLIQTYHRSTGCHIT